MATSGEKIERGIQPGGVRRCKRGHERTPDNVFPSNGGCKACAAERGRQYREENRVARQAQQAKYRAANREKLRAQNAERRASNVEAFRERARAHYHANREAIRLRQAEYREANRSAINAQKAEYRIALRRAAFDHYGHSCSCCGLGLNGIFLSIDHIAGGGAEHRRQLGTHGGAAFHQWLRDNGYPADFQTLCRSCNWGKRLRAACPHVEPIVPSTSKQKYLRRLKAEVVQAYGGECACCGEAGIDFLHLDHVNGGGKAHRKELAGNPGNFYPRLRQLGFPNDPPLRVLCDNCNHAIRFGPCPHGGITA